MAVALPLIVKELCAAARRAERLIDEPKFSEANFGMALRPPNGVAANGLGNLEMLVGNFGSTNNNFPDSPQFNQLPVYVPPGFEICVRCGDNTFGQGDVQPFIGSFGFVFDTVRDFDEAIEAALALDLPRPAVADWTFT